jgi:hypothetical protein
MKINPISLNRLRNDANFQFHAEFKELAEKQTPEGVAELKARNIALAELMRDRVDEGSVKVDIVLRKARTQLDEAYYAIAERVNAFVVIEGAASYESFIRKMNINIAKFNLLATQASKKPGKRGGGKNSTTGGSHEN